MNALKIIKRIESDNLQINGLRRYIGRKAEIIILIDENSSSNKNNYRDEALRIINECSGSVKKWTREEIHDR